ncbi:hypothetical protein D3C72_2090370 [compost metagenome]
MGVQLLEGDDGDEHIVLFEAEQAGRVMQQDVGVEDEQFADVALAVACHEKDPLVEAGSGRVPDLALKAT